MKFEIQIKSIKIRGCIFISVCRSCFDYCFVFDVAYSRQLVKVFRQKLSRSYVCNGIIYGIGGDGGVVGSGGAVRTPLFETD